MNKQTEKFQSKLGFILASVGSAVGLANIWAFPIRVGQNGGAVFILIYLLFIVIFSYVGLSAEFAAGRRAATGTLGAYEKAWEDKNQAKWGYLLAYIPLIGSATIAIGYAVIAGWVLRTFVASAGGALFTPLADGSIDSAAFFSAAADYDFGSVPWHLMIVIITLFTLFLGAKSIEKSNKIMMPTFFLLFVLLALRVAFLPGAVEGYKHLFIPQWEYALKPTTWIYAMGQAFFSLSITGSGMVAYGSYLKKDKDIVASSQTTGMLDTLAAFMAAIVIIPAGAAFGVNYESGGPGLMFITLPKVLAQIPYGRILSVFFFLSVIFAAVSSLQNMYEAVGESVINRFKIPRKTAVVGLGVVCFGIGLFVEKGANLGRWMDIVTIYIIPFGAVLGATSWFYLQKPQALLGEINGGAKHLQGELFLSIGRYVYVPLTILIFIAGFFYAL